MTTTKQTKQITEYNMVTFIQAIVDASKEGWKIDENNPPAFYGRIYEVILERNASDEQLAADAAELAKPSRAEILAKARAAKKAKEETAEA
jgi:hypothetical protein